jgi:YbbR domain-containing protein
VPLTPRDARGGEISRVSVSPETARISVDLEQREFSLALVVNPSIQGTAADGYNIAGINVDPRLVVVAGPIEALQSIDAVRGITTEEVSVADARDDVVRTVPLLVPPGARLLGNPTVQVSVDIEPARGEFSFRVVPQVRNVGDGLSLTQAEPITVTLAGEIPRLQSVTPESITVIADAQGLGPGVYSLPLQINAPPGTTVVRAEPPQLGITLTLRQ